MNTGVLQAHQRDQQAVGRRRAGPATGLQAVTCRVPYDTCRTAHRAISSGRESARVVRRTYHSVIRHRVVDAAASLTFFALLTVFPTALAVVSALSIVDRKGDSLTDIVEVLGFIVRPETASHLEGPLRQLLTLDNPWLGFTIGVVLTLWSLSGYATAFGRAMNTAYEVEEGRRIWKFRSMMLLVTLLIMVGGAVTIVILLGTPTISEAVIRQLGLAAWIDDVWNVAKWPVLAVDLVVMVAVLYYATPNVKTPQLRWVSAGAAFRDRDLGHRHPRVRALRGDPRRREPCLRGGSAVRSCCSCTSTSRTSCSWSAGNSTPR
ncbi:YihY/virulence factor BrkB family protein [Curtobacterium flaccumfaciens]|nr:YihY/virulence factor BrkB family protein [Curtobacterium flaccumfaciens]